MPASSPVQIERNRLPNLALLALLLSFAAPCWAAAPAGTSIVNTARTALTIDGASQAVTSNTAVTQVAELLNLTLSLKTAAATVIPAEGLAGFGIPFTLTNTGNGHEAFQVTAALAQAEALGVAVDVDGDGRYDPAVDIALPADGTTPVLAPGASLALLLRFAERPTGAGTATITAKAVTGSGTPGTTFAGGGDQGGDAVVGETHAEVSLAVPYSLSGAGEAGATLDKSQVVRAPDGSATPVAGAVVTYRLALSTSGAETMSDAQIVDPIPAGTAFVPGSIRIEDAAMSDVADADAAYFDGQAIHIALGEISQPTTRVVTFQVKIL